MPDQQQILSEYQEASSKVSDLIRNLSLGGLALVWIFKNDDNNGPRMDSKLIWALIFLVSSLSFDLIHYIIRTLTIYRVYTKTKKMKSTSGFYPMYLSNLSWLFFALKIISMVVAYFLIFSYAKNKI